MTYRRFQNIKFIFSKLLHKNFFDCALKLCYHSLHATLENYKNMSGRPFLNNVKKSFIKKSPIARKMLQPIKKQTAK